MVLRLVRAEREGIFVVSVRVVGAEDKELGGAMSDAGGVEHGDLVTIVPATAPVTRIVQGQVCGLEFVAEGGQEQTEPVALQLDSGLVPAFAAELLPEPEVGTARARRAWSGVRAPLALSAADSRQRTFVA